jgi:hypothetical protein
VRYGYRKIRVLLNREGWKVGKYLVERIYREEYRNFGFRPLSVRCFVPSSLRVIRELRSQ